MIYYICVTSSFLAIQQGCLNETLTVYIMVMNCFFPFLNGTYTVQVYSLDALAVSNLFMTLRLTF